MTTMKTGDSVPRSLSLSEMARTGVWVSLNKPSFTLPRFVLGFFLVRSQEPVPGPRDWPGTWGVTVLLHHAFLSCSTPNPQGHRAKCVKHLSLSGCFSAVSGVGLGVSCKYRSLSLGDSKLITDFSFSSYRTLLITSRSSF